MMSPCTVGFLGFGSMARAMAAGWRRADTPPAGMAACAGHYDRLKETAPPLGVTPCRDGVEVAERSQVLVAAVKPHLMEQVLSPLKERLAGKVLVSVASGWGFDRLEALLPGTHHLSIMPNTPVAVGEGVLLLEERHSLTAEEHAEVCRLLNALGSTETLSPAQFGIAGVLGGCGPAWAAMFLEALGDAGVYYGLPRETAYRVAAQMLAGTGKLQLESGAHPAAMKDAVCSPGGTTIAGVKALEEQGLRAAVLSAVEAVMARKRENER